MDKYEKALKRCKKEFNFNNLAYSHEEIKQKLQRIFPELEENEAERIRKYLIDGMKHLSAKSSFFTAEISKDKVIAWLEKQKEQKPITTEDLPNGEDYGIDSLWHAVQILEKTLGEVEGYQSDDGILEHKCAIEAIKRLYKQKPSGWSKEDELNFSQAIYVCHQNGYTAVENWLKSLKEKYTWKPSVTQMKALQCFLEHGCAASDKEASKAEKELEILYRDLKRLIGE